MDFYIEQLKIAVSGVVIILVCYHARSIHPWHHHT